MGLKIDVLKYWTRGDKRQPLRYVCRLRPGVEEEDVVFFTVLFELVGDGIVLHDDTMEGKQNGDNGHAEMNGIKERDEGGVEDEDVNMGVD